MKILLTAFDPFGGETVNPAQEAVRLVADEIRGVHIAKLIIPTVFGRSADTVTEAMRSLRPNAVVCVGQAGGRKAITFERVSINVDDASYPDNQGNQPVDQTIIQNGPAAYFSTLPNKAMVQAINNAGLPAAVSNTAGTFVCNHLMYGVMHLIQSEMPNTLGGFIHVPYLIEQAMEKCPPAFGMTLSDMVKGLEAALGAVARVLKDTP